MSLISNWPEMKVKAKCARALIRYLKAKESERENSNELCKTKLYYATCRHRVCGQNKDNLCLHAARTLIWRSCAFNRWPMTMPVLDGVKPMAITLPICGTSEFFVFLCFEREKKAYIAGLGRDQLEHLASPMTKSETSPSPNTNESKTSPRR